VYIANMTAPNDPLDASPNDAPEPPAIAPRLDTARQRNGIGIALLCC
jgi:hypothetical protein